MVLEEDRMPLVHGAMVGVDLGLECLEFGARASEEGLGEGECGL